jgi:hypothetical protein
MDGSPTGVTGLQLPSRRGSIGVREETAVNTFICHFQVRRSQSHLSTSPRPTLVVMGLCVSSMQLCSRTCCASLDSIRGSPKELYVTFFLKIFDSLSYFAISQIIIIYLHNEFGLDDITAGTCYGVSLHRILTIR